MTFRVVTELLGANHLLVTLAPWQHLGVERGERLYVYMWQGIFIF